jgi:hypothetical protein
MVTSYLLVKAGGSCVIYLFESITKTFKLNKLKREYKTLYGSSGGEAEKSLQRQMSNLKMKQPGRSDEWYLLKIISDLKRDRGKKR